MTLWDGVLEAVRSRWLRWRDEHSTVTPSGKERADELHAFADEEHRGAEHVEQLLAPERRRGERLVALLRRSGIDPERE